MEEDESTTPPEDLTTLSDKELTQREGRLAKDFERLENQSPTAELVAQMADIVAKVEALRAERQRRTDVAKELEQQKAELRSKLQGPAESEEQSDGEDGETGSEDDKAKEPAKEPAKADKPAEKPPAEPIAASGDRPRTPKASEIAQHTTPDTPAPERVPLSIVAAGDLPGFSAGTEIPTLGDVGEAFSRKVEALMGSRARGQVHVAQFQLDYPDDRTLTASGSHVANARKIEAVVGPEALVASGGICNPLEAEYTIHGIDSVADRPVRDALARFGATRGGIRFVTPPALSAPAAGVSHWTAANDAIPGSAGSTTKPCVTITCPSETSVTVEAVTLCIRVGNFTRMYFSELFDAWYAKALAFHARYAEERLLRAISTLSVRTTDGQNLGAASDLFEVANRSSTAYRMRHRMDPESVLEYLFPAWAIGVIRADIMRQSVATTLEEKYAFAQAQVERVWASLNLRPHYYLDTDPVDPFGMAAAQVAGPLAAWPLGVVSYVFAPGTFVFLDGGTLDLGVDIRDTGLISTNDVQAFMETFEGVARWGEQSVKIVSSICPDGSLSAPIDFVGCGAS
jgi:hypothetical protein